MRPKDRSLYDAVTRLQPAPVSRRLLLKLALVVLLPMGPLVLLEIPITEAFRVVVRTLL